MAFYPRDVSFIQRNDDNNLYTQVNISSSNAIFYTDENGYLTSSKIEEKFPYTWPSSSYSITSSYSFTSSTSQESISSSYAGTASYALNAGSGGGAEQLNTGSLYPITSSWSEDSISSSVSLNAETADFSVHSHASLVADTADYSIITNHALSSETADYAVDTTYALSSSHALWADTASHVIGLTTFSGSVNNYVPIWLNNTLTSTSSLYNTQSRIGINNTSPLADLHVGSGNDNNSVDAVILISRIADNTIPGNGHAFSDSTRFGRSGGVAYNSFDARNIMTGSYNYDHYAGFQYATTYDFDGTLTNAYGYASIPHIKNGNITNLYGSFIFNPSKTGGNVTNNYGLYVQELTIGTNRWGVYVAGGTPSYFGGGMTGSMFGSFIRCTYIGAGTDVNTLYAIAARDQILVTGSNSSFVMSDRSLVPSGENPNWSIYNNTRILNFFHSGSTKMTLDKTGSLETNNFIGQSANINYITCDRITGSFNGFNYLGNLGVRNLPINGFSLTVRDRIITTGSDSGISLSDRSLDSTNWTLFNQDGVLNIYRGTPVDATRLWISPTGDMTGSQDRIWWLPNGDIITRGFTGSLHGTASWARNALTSSYSEFVQHNVTQSMLYTSMSLSSSFASSSLSSSWSLTSLTSSYVTGSRSIVSSFTASTAITSAKADVGTINCTNITTLHTGSFNRLRVNSDVLSTPTTIATIGGTISVTGSDSSVAFYDRTNQANNGWSVRADDKLIFREIFVGDKIQFSRLGGIESTQLTSSTGNITTLSGTQLTFTRITGSFAEITSITGSLTGARADIGLINCTRITSSFDGPNYLGSLGVAQIPFPGISLTVRNRTMVTGSDSGFTMMDRNLDTTNWTIFNSNGYLNFYKGSPTFATRLWLDTTGDLTGSSGRTWSIPNGRVQATSFTGSLHGTASWALNTIGGGGEATLSTGSTYNITASWAVSASNARSASYALTSSYAITSSRAISSLSSSYALTSSRAISASWAPSSDPIEPSKTSYYHQTSTTMYLGDGNERQLLSGNRSQTAAGYGDVNREWHITAGGVINDDTLSKDWVWGFGLGTVSMSSIPLPWSGGQDSPWQFDGHLRFTATGAGGKIQGSGLVTMTSHIGSTRIYAMAFASETSVNLSTVQDLKLLVRLPTDHEVTCSHAIIQERGV